MQFDICATRPEALRSYLNRGLPRRVSAEGAAQFRFHEYHSWAGKRGITTQSSGLKLLRAEPVMRCVASAIAADPAPSRVILFSPRGRRLTQNFAKKLATQPRLVLVCGHFGGFEPGVDDALDAEHVSVGDYVLNSGEVAALVILDTVIRLIPGALHSAIPAKIAS